MSHGVNKHSYLECTVKRNIHFFVWNIFRSNIHNLLIKDCSIDVHIMLTSFQKIAFFYFVSIVKYTLKIRIKSFF